MISTVVTLLSLFSLFSLSLSQFNNNCGGYLTDGTYVSLSSIEGLYNLSNIPSSFSASDISLQVQVCGVISAPNSLCKTPGSAVNLITSDNKCISSGHAGVTAWEAIPGNQGVSLVYYHGLNLTHTNHLSTRIFFECSSTAEPMTFVQYVEDYYQIQVRIKTPFVCSDHIINPPPPPPSISLICETSFLGQYIELSALRALNGSFLFKEISPGVDFEVQSNYPSLCNKTTNSGANIIDVNSGECKSAGITTAYAWAPNPDSGAGVGLILYHGTSVGNGGNLQTRIYFECSALWDDGPNSTTPLPNEELQYEHFTNSAGNGGEYHLVVKTRHACPDSLFSTTSASGKASSASSSSTSSSSSVYVVFSFSNFIIVIFASVLLFL